MNTKNPFSRFLRKKIGASSRRLLRFQGAAVLLAGLFVMNVVSLNAADDQEDYARKIGQAHLFSQNVMWVGTSAPDEEETRELYQAMGLDPEHVPADRISSVEAFLITHPNSPWAPSLRANLARYYRTIGRYSVALDYWQKAWDATKDLRDTNARQVSDYTLAYWTDLLSSLGRVDKLKELITTEGGRRLSSPQFQRMFDMANKAAAIMAAQPGESFRCGSAALYHIAQTLDPDGDFSALLRLDSPPTGFSVAQLMDLSEQYHLGLVAVKRPMGKKELVVPSVVHWKEDHYAAILEKRGGSYQVIDPTFAGGIGGVLARTVNPSILKNQLSTFASAYYHSDGNGNITCLIYTNQTIGAKYEYDPYGNILSRLGPLADVNLYRFSSKEFHPASGLIYYLYRYYEPNLQRWLNRDSLQERGGLNLYSFVKNGPVIYFDSFGLIGVITPVPLNPGGPATIYCKGGKYQIWNPFKKEPWGSCVDKHEQQHIDDWKKRYGDDSCKGVPDGSVPTGGDGYEKFLADSECKAHAIGRDCEKKAAHCKNPNDSAEDQLTAQEDNMWLKAHNCPQYDPNFKIFN